MKFFPTPPTDNLYKFCAILGAWLVAGVIALFMLLGYVTYDLEKQSVAQTHHFRTMSNYEKVIDRLSSIEQGKLDENIIEWLPSSDGSENEVDRLLEIKANQEKAITEYENEIRTDYGEIFEVVEATGIWWVICVLISLSVLCFYFGFKLWYIKVQKISDELLVLDVEIKRLTLRQLEKEVSKSRKFVVPQR
ncbi:hypothetical protein [Vibrio parahaemolyticus]|uniref:hypothetical protein n=1 Tax=Vibrio parahaemolyticus TaxID=670 RepID=UPI00193E4EF3|nr:hypothetical protein [Vibrio parahaemolyticus]EHK4786486.1 hypothetical protein [Vibrio parahaemolyticus]EIJ0975340.1 hypothetical protein [Vibrio parahaemolyticus]EJO4006050.1 hypothetical protein [Vibrio parahaemolyticus]MBM4991947.1 hypothetical protein [Vibrio parahaemolyticus]MBM4996532.1 hypothetical protein [Vibrio parahaemolyticus]